MTSNEVPVFLQNAELPRSHQANMKLTPSKNMIVVGQPTEVETVIADCIFSTFSIYRDNVKLGLYSATKTACELMGQSNLALPVYLMVKTYENDAYDWADGVRNRKG